MFVSRCKTVIKLFLSIIIVAFAVIGFRFTCVSKLSNFSGERVFYLYSPSSQAQIKTKISIIDGFFVRGESVKINLDGVVAERKAEEILSSFNAEVLFTEQAGQTLSYYAYAPKLGGGILLNGKKINLHIAFSDSQCVVGTPIIFGGF